MLRLVPARTKACVHAAPRHLLHGGDDLRVLTWVSEGHWAHQRAECDARRLTRNAREDTPRITRRLICRTWERFIVIRAIEGIKAELLSARRDCELLHIGESHLPLNHNADLHVTTLAREDSLEDEEYDDCNANYRSTWQRRM